MKKFRYTPEQVAFRLRQAEVCPILMALLRCWTPLLPSIAPHSARN